MFYSPFPHGSQREATVRLLPHSVNTVTTRQAWADLIMLNRGFLPTSDQHWIAALPPHPKPPDLPSALDGKSHHHHHHHHQRCLSGVKCEMMAERWAACLKEREVERGGRCRGGGVKIHYIYTHTQTACLAIQPELQVISSLPPPPPLLRTPPVLSAEEKTKPNKRDCVGLQLDEPPD